MKHLLSILVVLPSFLAAGADMPLVVVDHVRFHPGPARFGGMAGGKFLGSNISASEGFVVLGEILTEPKADAWTELKLADKGPFRWVRYEPPVGVKGSVAELEFYSGERKLSGTTFGAPVGAWRAAFDTTVALVFNTDGAGVAYAGIDLGEQASTRRPMLSAKAEEGGARVVSLSSPTAGATIRYTLDGSMPDERGGQIYSEPLNLSATSTVTAAAFKEGLAASPPAVATYQIGPPVAINSFHIGNSLTGNASRFPFFARTAGVQSEFKSFLMGGALTAGLWKAKEEGNEKEHFARIWVGVRHPLDHVTVQPRDFNIDAEVEAELKFFNLVREKSPQVQPWLYAEWVEKDRHRPSDKGIVPSYQMNKLYPALTWEESMSAMMLYVEEVQHRVNGLDKGAKRARILPCSIAMGLARTLVDTGKLPGIAPGEASYYAPFFEDHVHVNPAGCYLVDLVWYAAFLGKSPEGKMLPVGTNLTGEQAKVLQKLAWEIVKNYPDCGLFEEGKEAVAVPEFSVAAGGDNEPRSVRLSSTTPGAFFRYTLDGTTPTRTRGYVYCGVITARPGMTVKAIGFKSGMGDSTTVGMMYGEKK